MRRSAFCGNVDIVRLTNANDRSLAATAESVLRVISGRILSASDCGAERDDCDEDQDGEDDGRRDGAALSRCRLPAAASKSVRYKRGHRSRDTEGVSEI